MRAQGWCRSPSDNTLIGFCLQWHAWKGRHLKESKCIWTEAPRPGPKEKERVKKVEAKEAKEAKVGARTQQTGGVMAEAGALGFSGCGFFLGVSGKICLKKKRKKTDVFRVSPYCIFRVMSWSNLGQGY